MKKKRLVSHILHLNPTHPYYNMRLPIIKPDDEPFVEEYKPSWGHPVVRYDSVLNKSGI